MVDGRPSVFCSEVEYSNVIILPPNRNCCTGATLLVFTGKEGVHMVSLSEIIAVIGVVIAAFGLGYRLGRDKRHDVKNARE